MKKLMMFVLSGLAFGLLTNCGQNNGPSASTSMSANCYFQQTSGASSTYGYMGGPCNYNYNMLSAQGFSSSGGGYGSYGAMGSMYGGYCSSNQMAVYSPTKGLGCVNASSLMMNGQAVMYTLSQATMSFVPSSTPMSTQFPSSYGSGYGTPYTTGTGMTVLRVCDTASEPCPSGQNCRSPVGGGLNGVGVCYF
jgi:hypothetical protein